MGQIVLILHGDALPTHDMQWSGCTEQLLPATSGIRFLSARIHIRTLQTVQTRQDNGGHPTPFPLLSAPPLDPYSLPPY